MKWRLQKKGFLLAITAYFAIAVTFLFTPLFQASASINYGEEVVSFAQMHEGKKFKMGGTSPEGFDASGYTQYVYKTAATHLPIPRTSNDQYKAGKSIKANKLQLGDVVFYATGHKKGKVTFSAIYIGEGKFIGATSKGVKTVNMSDKYWKERYVGAKRYIQ
ncbi:C40 family peptidase [Heyndrickxia sp. FSL K6-6286]|uniref:C40 family peptidase n=1 Tax=Heyndrickxia sp. FSL K6-6286 TaxID=2921510 RepID=UPI0003A21E38